MIGLREHWEFGLTRKPAVYALLVHSDGGTTSSACGTGIPLYGEFGHSERCERIGKGRLQPELAIIGELVMQKCMECESYIEVA